MGSRTDLKAIIRRLKNADKIDKEVLDALTDQEKEVLSRLHEEGLLNEALKFLDALDVDKEYNEALKKFVGSQKKKKAFRLTNVLKYAAILVGFVSIGYYLLENIEFEPDAISEVSGKNIKLKMATGTVEIIEQGQTRKLVNSDGQVTVEQHGNTITYQENVGAKELVFNELEIPLGMIFNVELSDGTFVHLNSGTKIRYPIAFLKGQKREVFVEGEAFFDVTKDIDRPFVVHAGKMEVEVLGTQFNVSSYKEDAEMMTVLVEGSVEIRDPDNERGGRVLTPGTKGSWYKKSNSISVEDVDVNLYTGWLRGELVFRNTSFSSMEKKLERSYDVNILNKNKSLAQKLFNARFNVGVENIEEVLKSISEIHPFTYSIDVNGENIVIN